MANADGSHKYKLSVINKYKQPLCFHAAGINIANLPIFYYHNKTAWMQVSIWYHFLKQFNEYMQISHRQVILISDNAPTHPHPDMPPKSYTGPSPPCLSHVRLIYIDPNLTAYLQPLDAGIIAAFKAAYRRKYASLLVSRYNSNPTAAVEWKLNVLEAINLAIAAWDEIPASTIFHCWQKTGIHPYIDRAIVGRHDQFLTDIQQATRISVASLLNHTTDQAPDVEQITKLYLQHDEDVATTDVSTVCISEHVADCISAGLTSIAGIDNDLESNYKEDIPAEIPTLITGTAALNALEDLQNYFLSLPISTLPPVLATHIGQTNISDIAVLLSSTRQSLNQYLETQKTQSNLDKWIQRS